MMFHLSFGIPGLIFLGLLLLAIPLLLTLYLHQRQVTAQIQRQFNQAGPDDAQKVSATSHSDDNDHSAYLQFIRYFSHQSTNALQAILGALTNLETSSATDDAEKPDSDSVSFKGMPSSIQSESIRQIATETRRLLEMTAKLRLLARLESGDASITLQPVQIRSIVADVIMAHADRAQAQGIELRYQGPDRPPRSLLDREQISQALHNLVDNSLKYAKPDSCRIVISVVPSQTALQLIVSDDGIGIPKALLPQVFDVAYRVPDARNHRHTGSGLGLAIVQRIVQRHNGKIEIESEYGQGTTISITLPITLEQ